ncbi:protein kinase domain-containing protein [Neorhizobium alkalisoli]|uniref:Serine/threonine protein kinase n=1 Tax=Neorhizobium alkalisoli TaxID=528178 RepID=A0A561QI83_9HYPH|nr:protein kinase [Neorhizobium alkalisoli]TWF50056.1 serine/threonine protein kinase [Neorhizobium alkalisoli]
MSAGFDDIGQRFSALWNVLTKDGDALRPAEERALLVDQVRDALDRAEDRLSEKQATILANTFTLEERIYDGRIVEIHRARHRDLGTLHAIKLLKQEHADDPVAKRLLLREAGIGLGLRHPNLVTTQTLLRLADGRPALISEWCRNSLAEHLRLHSVSLTDIEAIMKSLLSGLSAMHDAGYVHCDVSPSNLLFYGDSPVSIKLSDLGIALEIGRRHADLDLSFAGQPDLAAPEQRDGDVLDGRTDLYSAGRLLLILLDHCPDASGPDGEPLRFFAGRLCEQDRTARPENAKAALIALDGFQK